MELSPNNSPHVAVCPSAGIGHLTPFLRLASMLASSNCKVTLIIIRPTLSLAETNQISNFLSTHPHITSFEFHLDPISTTTTTNIDPFLLQYDTVSCSAHRLIGHFSAVSPPLSAVFSDLLLASGLGPHLGFPNYILITSSARFFSFMICVPSGKDYGRLDIPMRDLPPIFLDKNSLFHKIIDTNCRCLKYAKGILLNTFDFFEPESISTLQSKMLIDDELPPIFPLGPLLPLKSTNGNHGAHGSDYDDYQDWLDEQPVKSAVYVSFGSRTAMSREQIKEIGDGLERSGMRFLWVIKTTIVDKEEKEDVKELLGEDFLERNKKFGLVVKGWVSQDAILAHPSIGGFVSHCGWNSVMEAAYNGVPLLAWPLHGDQRVNAWVVEKSGLGIWESEWGWGEERLVKAEEVAMKVEELMKNLRLRDSATRVGEEAKKAWDVDGSSTKMFKRIIDECTKNLVS